MRNKLHNELLFHAYATRLRPNKVEFVVWVQYFNPRDQEFLNTSGQKKLLKQGEKPFVMRLIVALYASLRREKASSLNSVEQDL